MSKYDIAAYVWPSYTGDEPRARIFWEEGYGEWQTVKSAVAKYEGHRWPRKPLWGYLNEADPYVMEMQISAAADHGVNTFIYDWYWYDGRPFLEHCLNNGFLKAKNNSRMKFYLMWANHDATSLWHKPTASWDAPVIWQGKVSNADFDLICDRIINNYFVRDNYYKINGEPVFMIYDLQNLINSFGDIDNTAKAIDLFRKKTVKAGLDGLHLQLAKYSTSHNILKTTAGEVLLDRETFSKLGFASLTNYQYCHFLNMDREYRDIVADAVSAWDKFAGLYDAPYFPHVSLGWDTNPRFKMFVPGVVKNNTPEAVKEALLLAKEYMDKHRDSLPAPLITINSWNEWTEASYLQPDDINGYGYLEAVKSIFK